MLNGLKIYYFHDRVIATPKKICLEDKAEMKKAKKKVWVRDLNRSIIAEAQAWEKLISDQAGPSL